MSGTTTRLGLYLPGGGSTGAYGADEPADVDKAINQNMQKLDVVADLVNGRLGATNLLVTGDWNNQRTTGFFMGQNMANAPQNNSSWFFVTVQRYSDDYVTQFATGFTDLQTRNFIRVRAGGVWNKWMELYQNRGGINQTTNWNTLNTPGTYRYNGASGVSSGFPSGAYNFGTLVVVVGEDDQGGLTQTYYPDGAGPSRGFYLRTTFGNNFSSGAQWGAFGASSTVGSQA